MKIIHRTAADTSEHLVHEGRCRVYHLYPELTTSGTITLRDAAATGGSNVKHVAAAALTQLGKDFRGALFANGLTIQLSNGADLSALVWEAV